MVMAPDRAVPKYSIQAIEEMLRGGGVQMISSGAQTTEEITFTQDGDDGTGLGTQEITLVRQNKADTTTVTMYNRMTGDAVPVTVNNVMATLKKLVPDQNSPIYGQQLFTMDKNNAPKPVRGTLPCVLHPQHPDFAKFSQLAGGKCRKRGIMTPGNVMEHLRIKHPITWKMWRQKEEEDERAEAREFRRLQIAQMRREQEQWGGLSTGADGGEGEGEGGDRESEGTQVAVHRPARKPSRPRNAVPGTAYQKDCPHCGQLLSAGGRLAWYNILKKHERENHPEMAAPLQ